MKRILITMILAVALFGCGRKNLSEKPIVTVSILPQKYFVEQIAGDYFDINVLAQSGTDPHEYEPTAKQLVQLANSEVYFYVGHLGFEKTWLERMMEAAPKTKLISNSIGLDLLENRYVNDEDNTFYYHGTDPHVWTSPENVKKICKNIAAELSMLHPDQKDVFDRNTSVFVERIDSLDFAIREQLNDIDNKTFMIYHPALSYFARDYYLDQYVIEYEGKTPSPAHIKNTIDFAKKENIKTVFIQSQFEMSKAEVIAKEIGAEVIVVDPLAYDWMYEMSSLSKKMQEGLIR